MNCSTPGLTVHHQTPRVHQNPCPSSQCCHPTISSSVVPFSSCPQCFPASGSFPFFFFFSISKILLIVQNSTKLHHTMVILSHKGYSTIMNRCTVSRNREIRGRSGIGLGGRQWDQAVGSKVTKRDVFHSKIYYNTTEAPEGGG